ncbi:MULTISPECIES: hypothetical protein [unclassified Streptomyces]|uniref:hypothetical protein n=1 Tax=unclassified Streptomyces TaxID=2593676 RepID=UPI002E292C9A|nr:hypothetical protein [Streptomyces sp. NBC_01439]
MRRLLRPRVSLAYELVAVAAWIALTERLARKPRRPTRLAAAALAAAALVVALAAAAGR